MGKCIFQRIELNSERLFKEEKKNLSQKIARILNSNMLCLGNIKLTGEHSFELSNKLELSNLDNSLEILIKDIKNLSAAEGKPIKLLLVKDFYEQSLLQAQNVFKGYHALAVEPNMILKLEPEWESLDNYLLDLRTKYRTRAKSAFKKGEQIEFRELNINEIEENEDILYRLYLNVLKNIAFSAYQLPKNYFKSMKCVMPNDYHLMAGFLDGEMICFYTIIHNQKSLETGFLGYDDNIQQSLQLYLNMLYQMVDYGIKIHFETIIFSRSALEIKSSIGAEATPSYGLLKHTNPILNQGLKLIFNQFYEPKEFVPRNPFKK